jgi:heme exporter protein CcmD
MNDYGLFIFLAYGVTALVISALTLRILLDYRHLRAELARLEKSRLADRGDTP